jgi:hypothetical protein
MKLGKAAPCAAHGIEGTPLASLQEINLPDQLFRLRLGLGERSA